MCEKTFTKAEIKKIVAQLGDSKPLKVGDKISAECISKDVINELFPEYKDK